MKAEKQAPTLKMEISFRTVQILQKRVKTIMLGQKALEEVEEEEEAEAVLLSRMQSEAIQVEKQLLKVAYLQEN